MYSMTCATFLSEVSGSLIHKTILIAVLCILTLTGCTGTDPETSPSKNISPSKQVMIGLIPERNIFRQLERYEPLAVYISKKTDTAIKLKVLVRYGNITENFVTLGLDGAFLGSFTYALAHIKLGVEPIVRPELEDGTSSYFGMIFVRKDSGITNAEDMKDKVFAFVDRATTAGHLLPLAYFKKNKIQNYAAYLKEYYFAGTHEDAIYDVLNGKADIGAAKNTVYYYLEDIDSRINNELVILETSPRVPANGLALRKDIDPVIRNAIKNTFLTMHHDPEGRSILKHFKVVRFIETKDSDYAAVYDYIHATGMNLQMYDSVNE